MIATRLRACCRAAALGAALVGCLPQPADGQTAGATTARVQVLGAITLSARTLAFGTIASTATTTVPPTSNSAGRLTITGQRNTPVQFTITSLPATLGAPTLGLGAWQGRANRNNNATGGGVTSFVPATGYSATYTLSPSGQYFVFFGATLTATGAAAGSYSAPITVSVAYF